MKNTTKKSVNFNRQRSYVVSACKNVHLCKECPLCNNPFQYTRRVTGNGIESESDTLRRNGWLWTSPDFPKNARGFTQKWMCPRCQQQVLAANGVGNPAKAEHDPDCIDGVRATDNMHPSVWEDDFAPFWRAHSPNWHKSIESAEFFFAENKYPTTHPNHANQKAAVCLTFGLILKRKATKTSPGMYEVHVFRMVEECRLGGKNARNRAEYEAIRYAMKDISEQVFLLPSPTDDGYGIVPGAIEHFNYVTYIPGKTEKDEYVSGVRACYGMEEVMNTINREHFINRFTSETMPPLKVYSFGGIRTKKNLRGSDAPTLRWTDVDTITNYTNDPSIDHDVVTLDDWVARRCPPLNRSPF